MRGRGGGRGEVLTKERTMIVFRPAIAMLANVVGAGLDKSVRRFWWIRLGMCQIAIWTTGDIKVV